MDRIFDPFFSTKEAGEGTGLGLAVVHGIVKSHGGAIEVVSHPDQGTSVQVLFPVQEVAATPEDGDTAPLPLGQEQILLVDDEPALTHVVKHLLERLGYQVESHTNGLKALEAFRRHLRNQPFDLVITDMTMPQITGAALAQELLKLKPQIPIILLTGYSDKIDAAKARSLGVREFLHKPLVLRDLALLVRKILDRNPRSR